MMDNPQTQLITRALAAYAAMHPRPAQVTQKQAAEMLHLSEPTVRKLVRAGTLRLNACGLIPITEVDRALEAKTL